MKHLRILEITISKGRMRNVIPIQVIQQYEIYQERTPLEEGKKTYYQ